MSMLSEAIQEVFDSYRSKSLISINVIIKPALDEGVMSSDIEVIPDDQALEDWYDFADNVESIIKNFGEIENISMSNNPQSVSEYIDFYTYDKEGNLKDYMIDLRLSNHKSTTNARTNRKSKASKITGKYKLASVVVNDKSYTSYDDALKAVKLLLAKDLMND